MILNSNFSNIGPKYPFLKNSQSTFSVFSGTTTGQVLRKKSLKSAKKI